MDPADFELAYQEYMHDLKCFVPDGIVEIDLPVLEELGITSTEEIEEVAEESDDFTHAFYVVESSEKLTLFNQKFVIWIVPKMIDKAPTTFTLIALNEKTKPHLEMVFSTRGVYNHSGLVLKILDKFLSQIEDNENEIFHIKDEG